jgi:hypothetical protein
MWCFSFLIYRFNKCPKCPKIKLQSNRGIKRVGKHTTTINNGKMLIFFCGKIGKELKKLPLPLLQFFLLLFPILLSFIHPY